MIISKSSWHYRVIDKFSDWKPPTNLCPYMRKLIGTLLLICFVAPSVLYGMLEVAAFTWYGKEIFLAYWTGMLETISMVLAIHAVLSWIAGGVAWLFVCLAAIAWTGDKVKAYRSAKEIERAKTDPDYHNKTTYKQSEPSIITVWLEALHDKACPIIEFREKNSD